MASEMPLAAFPTVPGILSLKHLISGNLQLGSSNKTEPMPRNLLRLSFAGRVPSFIPNNFLKSTAVSSSESSVAKLSSICLNANLEIMCLLINLAVIRLSLQIVIPGIMIVFRGSKKSRSIAHCCFVSLQQPSLPATGGRGDGAPGRALTSCFGQATSESVAWHWFKDGSCCSIGFSGLTLFGTKE